ncbi:CGNR zinc finger domain-containing protein [Streptomyces wuyuanensis]|uniref:CGNR zinc finger domain-containing protein n=1 Tax=Streptomyces wuyuanensis TaxID=1196353 RepID=UPI0037143A5C
MGIGSYDGRFDSGRVCLDLVAAAPQGPEGLGRWLMAAGLLPPGTPLGAVTARWVVPFHELRVCVEGLVDAEIDRRRPVPGTGSRGGPAAVPGRHGGPDLALARLNSFASASAPPAVTAVRDDEGELVRAPLARPECAALLAAVARDAVELLTDSVARTRLRRCEGDNCRRVYLDTSRGRRRRWCSSEVCGNRERVARHRRRAALPRA